MLNFWKQSTPVIRFIVVGCVVGIIAKLAFWVGLATFLFSATV